jgi:dephospho-CoA kinase
MIIGLTGNIGSGKTTSAEYIKKKYGFTEYAFADPIKKIAMTIGFDYKDIYGTQSEKLYINNFWGISGREFLQKFGKETCRDFLPTILPNMNIQTGSIWINVFKRFIDDNEEKDIIVSDVRFINEYKSIIEKKGIVIKIIRGNELLDTNQDFSAYHSSEMNFDNIDHDYVINNDGTKEELFHEIDMMMNCLK